MVQRIDPLYGYDEVGAVWARCMGDEQQVSFVADGNRLEGMLAVPDGAGEAVVVCHSAYGTDSHWQGE